MPKRPSFHLKTVMYWKALGNPLDLLLPCEKLGLNWVWLLGLTFDYIVYFSSLSPLLLLYKNCLLLYKLFEINILSQFSVCLFVCASSFRSDTILIFLTLCSQPLLQIFQFWEICNNTYIHLTVCKWIYERR